MSQTNPQGRTRLTRRLILDLVCIVIFGLLGRQSAVLFDDG
jgi:hypothetical protein